MTPGWDIVESTDISSHFGGVTFLQEVSLSGNISWGCGNPYLRFEWHFPTFFCTFDSYVKRFDHIAGTSMYPDNEFRKKRKINTSMMPQEYPANIWLLLGEVLDLVELNISAGHMAQPVMMRLVQTKRRFCVSTVPRDGVGEDSNSKCRSTLLLPVQERKPARWSCGLGHRAWINSITNAVLVRVWCHDPFLCQVGWFKL